jgi:TRAP-type C4-dicarboxylate transport system permease small subunit
MNIRRISQLLGYVTDPLALGLNVIAGFCLAVMMALTGVDVGLRYFFNYPIPGSYEITAYIMPAVVAFGLAYCALGDGHVQVDLFTSNLPQRIQNILRSVADFVMFAVYALITWQAIVRVKELMASQQHSEVLYLPIFPFVIVVAVGCAVFSLVALKLFLDHLSESISP